MRARAPPPAPTGPPPAPKGAPRRISRPRIVTFGAACRGCPLRARCTSDRRGRHLTLHEHDALHRAHRARWHGAPALQAASRRYRPMVERSLAWLTRGARRVPYRGVVKNDAWWHLRAAAVNLRRLLALGLTGGDGQWALTGA